MSKAPTKHTEDELPLQGQYLRYAELTDNYEYLNGLDSAAPLDDANIITSLVEPRNWPRKHKVVMDIDMPVTVLASSTPGHHHLYIDHEMTEEQYFKLCDVMAEVGLLETGYVRASRDRGFTALRLPWIKKEDKR